MPLAVSFAKSLTHSVLCVSSGVAPAVLLGAVADENLSRSNREGVGGRRSSPRTVLTVHRPSVIAGNVDTKQQRRRSPGSCQGAAKNAVQTRSVFMTEARERRTDEEPMGIVISRGSRAESTPRFSAYVWCQVGENTPTSEPRAA